MATWKKMAEAFGRAMGERGLGHDIKSAETIARSKGADWEGKYSKMTPEQRAYKHGYEVEGDANYQVAKERAGEDPSKSYSEHVDDVENENSDMRLRKDLEEAIDAAIKRRNETDFENLRMPKSGFTDGTGQGWKDWHEEVLREKMIKQLQSGASITDVLDAYNFRLRQPSTVDAKKIQSNSAPASDDNADFLSLFKTAMKPEEDRTIDKLLYDAYDFDEARAYGPEHAYSLARERVARNHKINEDELPRDMDAFAEQFGYNVDD